VAGAIINRRDLDFQLFEALDTEALTSRPRYAEHSKETFLAVLDTAEAMAEEKFAPHNRKADEHEPTFDGQRVSMIPEVGEALKAFCDAGFIAAAHDFERGGMQLPVVMTQAAFSLFKGANVGTAAYPFLTIANANVIHRFGSEAQRAKYLDALLTGRFFGTMALTEPQAGSSLSDITTSADAQSGRQLFPARQQDLHFRRRPRTQREHRAPGAGQDSRRPARRQGHLAVHRAQVPRE
jgi:alkylation response protein AidB-like acyl-CoA dehydrogenase